MAGEKFKTKTTVASAKNPSWEGVTEGWVQNMDPEAWKPHDKTIHFRLYNKFSASLDFWMVILFNAHLVSIKLTITKLHFHLLVERHDDFSFFSSSLAAFTCILCDWPSQHAVFVRVMSFRCLILSQSFVAIAFYSVCLLLLAFFALGPVALGFFLDWDSSWWHSPMLSFLDSGPLLGFSVATILFSF